MTQETTSKLKWLSSIGGALIAIISIYEGYVKIKDSMDETAKEKIEQWTLPVVKAEIKATVDSIFKHRTYSKSVGIRWIPEEDKLEYIHTNGKSYRPFLDVEQDAYYFINDNNHSEWCK